MSHVVDVEAEGVRAPLGRQRVADIARAVLQAENVREARLSITFVDNRRIAALNRRHLRHAGATDVISFALNSGAAGGGVIGDIYIAPDVARRNARANRVAVREELTRLVVHGVLHVIGNNHPEGERRHDSPMWRRQEHLVRSLVGRGARHRVRREYSAA
jgi:probable rRNA maturation factor